MNLNRLKKIQIDSIAQIIELKILQFHRDESNEVVYLRTRKHRKETISSYSDSSFTCFYSLKEKLKRVKTKNHNRLEKIVMNNRLFPPEDSLEEERQEDVGDWIRKSEIQLCVCRWLSFIRLGLKFSSV